MRFSTCVLCALMMMAFSPGAGVGNTGLPHEFDALVPVYSSAKPIDTRYTRDSVKVSFTTRDAFDRVVAFYKQALADKGWQVLRPDTGKKLVASNKKINLTLTETPNDHGFIIDLQYPGGRE